MSEKNLTNLDELFRLMHEMRSSDLHLQVGSKPVFRISGTTRFMEEFPVLTTEKMKELIFCKLSQPQINHFENLHRDLDFACGVQDVGRFRINLFYQRGTMALVARLVQSEIRSFEDLHLPKSIGKISHERQGLVIIAGVTGSGKSTTLATIIEYINRQRECHVLTIEDPIEFLFKNKKAYINQREVGIDVPTFKDALKYAVRQDPNVMMIGEMRDDETVQFGLSAAETGHLVFGTLHSSNAAQTFGRILDLFPPDKHEQMRSSMSFNLKSIVAQKLLPAVDEKTGRVPAVEVMFNNPGIRKLIREGQFEKIPSVIETSAEEGMQSFNQSILQLEKDKLISQETGLKYSPNAEELKMMFKGIILKKSGLIGG
jgi:twitching motility protein PilT